MRAFRRVALALGMALLLVSTALPVLANNIGEGAIAFQEGQCDRHFAGPDRPADFQCWRDAIRLDSPIRGVTISPGETRIDLDVDLVNIADDPREVRLAIESAPDGWDVGLWNAFFRFRINDIVVEPSDDTPGQRPRLRIELPDPWPEPGEYSFDLVVMPASPTADGTVYSMRNLSDVARFTVTVPEPEAEADERQVTARSTFPILRGPSDSEYEFEITIKNEVGEDSSFSMAGNVLSATQEPLQGWEVGFAPSFGEAKLISSIDVASGLTERVDVRVTPPRNAAPGDYFIPVLVTNEEYETTTILQLTVVGKGLIGLGTGSGRLNVDAKAGDATPIGLVISNVGTGALSEITLSADLPNGWESGFDSEVIEGLARGFQISPTATITTPGDLVPGDYLVTIRAQSREASETLMLRVTVDQSTIWGWVGILLVLVVIGGLVALFIGLGRR